MCIIPSANTSFNIHVNFPNCLKFFFQGPFKIQNLLKVHALDLVMMLLSHLKSDLLSLPSHAFLCFPRFRLFLKSPSQLSCRTSYSLELSACFFMTSFRANILARVLPRRSSVLLKAFHLEAQDTGGLTMTDAEFEHLVKAEIALIFCKESKRLKLLA